MAHFTERLLKRRHELKLSQPEVARRSGHNQPDISRYETGAIDVSFTILDLSRALRCDPYWLAFGDEKGAVPDVSMAADLDAISLAREYSNLPPDEKDIARSCLEAIFRKEDAEKKSQSPAQCLSDSHKTHEDHPNKKKA